MSSDLDADVIRVTLQGGPTDLPETVRCQLIAADTITVKVPHRGGYEHFTRSDESVNPAIFRWSMRTWLAE